MSGLARSTTTAVLHRGHRCASDAPHQPRSQSQWLVDVMVDSAFQDPCHSETREQKYVQQHIRICTHGVKTGLG